MESFFEPITIYTFFVLLIFGVLYAAYIYHRPFEPGWTWLSVVIGVAVTSSGIMFLDWMYPNDGLFLALNDLMAYSLTGAPMIVSQTYKYKKNQKEIEENGELNNGQRSV